MVKQILKIIRNVTEVLFVIAIIIGIYVISH